MENCNVRSRILCPQSLILKVLQRFLSRRISFTFRKRPGVLNIIMSMGCLPMGWIPLDKSKNKGISKKYLDSIGLHLKSSY